MTTTARFWNQAFAASPEIWNLTGAMELAGGEAAKYFGALKGKRIIDLGCGPGATSLFFARLGASVVSIDQSDVAISRLQQMCRENSIDTVHAVVGDVHDISSFAPVDFVFGSMILHHIDRFESFSVTLRQTVRVGGRCFFFENNAASRLLMWFRDHLAGKFGIPKYGDTQEHPLTAEKLNVLRNHFSVRQGFPSLMYFHLLSVYLLHRRLSAMCDWLDRTAYRIPAVRPYSYRQYVYLS